MKKDLHPDYNNNVTITCSCGAQYETGSTKQDIQIELCSACHPFFTGTQKIVDTARRVEKFKARDAKKAADAVQSRAAKKAAKRAKRAEKGPKYEVEEAKGATVKKAVAKN